MAYLRDLPQPKCYACGKRASVQLIGRQNEDLYTYCKPCGRDAVKSCNLWEDQQMRTERVGR